MYRFLAVFSILFTLILTSTISFGQEPASIIENFGRRAAKLPQYQADTGIEFDEYRLERAAREYYNGALFSGENAGKTMQQIETESYDAVRNMENKMAFKSQSSSAWQQIAGSQDGHVSGRVRGIAFDPSSNTVYIVAATGGIWKTNDITGHPVAWINLSDRLPTCNFGSIAVDPKRPNVVYAGTGESVGDNYLSQVSGSAYDGAGLFRSLDGGLNWDTVATTALAGSVCSQIVIDPINTDTVYVATGNSSILKSYDGGNTWKKVTVGGTSLSIALDPVNTNNLYVAGTGSIYRSVDYGETWIKCTTGLPSSSGRFTVAVAPSAPNLVYVSIGTIVNSTNRPTLGVWASTDYGVTWVKKMQYNPALPASATNANPLGTQQEWCNAIAVHPTNPKRIFVGGLDIYQSVDSGKNYTQLTDWTASVSAANFVHADIHTLVFNGSTLYACTDGGIAKTTSFGAWSTDMNQGISTLQFVGVDANKEFTYVTGGCQDNSTNRALIGDAEFHQTIGGDGGHAWVSQEQGQIAYTTYVYTNFKQSLDSGKTWGPNLIQPSGDLAKEGSPFYTVYDCNGDGSVVALGGNSHIWVSTSGGTDGFPASGKSNLAISNSWGIHVSPFDPSGSIIWASSGSTVYHTFDVGATWAKGTSVAGAGTITGITSSPADPSIVYAVSISGKHFWKSIDSGKTFSGPATNFPNIPCWCIARHPGDGRLFVGTEKGIFWSQDDGVTWYPAMEGLPYVNVSQLRIRGTGNDKLLAGTYGRGMFWLDLSTLGTNPMAKVAESLSLEPSYPNPITNGNATIGFTLKDAGLATITLHDILGRELRILGKSYFDAGKHEIALNLDGFTSGTYYLLLTQNGKSVSEKIILN